MFPQVCVYGLKTSSRGTSILVHVLVLIEKLKSKISKGKTVDTRSQGKSKIKMGERRRCKQNAKRASKKAKKKKTYYSRRKERRTFRLTSLLEFRAWNVRGNEVIVQRLWVIGICTGEQPRKFYLHVYIFSIPSFLAQTPQMNFSCPFVLQARIKISTNLEARTVIDAQHVWCTFYPFWGWVPARCPVDSEHR